MHDDPPIRLYFNVRHNCYNNLMQKQPKSHLCKNLLFGSLSLLILGFILVGLGLSNLYSSVNKCGFGAGGGCSYSNAHGNMAKIGSYIVATGFYASIIFLIAYLKFRHKEKTNLK